MIVKAVIVAKVEELVLADRATQVDPVFALVFIRFYSGAGSWIDRGWSVETPCVQCRRAHVFEYGAVDVITARLDHVVLKTDTLVLRRLPARNHLKLIDRFYRDGIRNVTRVALLVDTGLRKPVDVDLVHATDAAGAVEDARLYRDSTVRNAGSQIDETGRVAHAAVHLQRKLGVVFTLDRDTGGRAGSV